MSNETKVNSNILEVKKREQYETVEELINKSQPTSIYYTLLILSSFIIAAGLLLDNSAIVIGGMLITPVLSPIIVIALGLSVGELKISRDASQLLLKSFLIIILSSLLMTFLLGASKDFLTFENSFRTAILYFIVAVASGIAATFAWVKKEIADVLPGISIAVSLVPPISLIGIWIANFNIDQIRFYLSLLIFNLIGIVIGSIIVFSLLRFHQAEKKIERIEKKIERIEKKESKQ